MDISCRSHNHLALITEIQDIVGFHLVANLAFLYIFGFHEELILAISWSYAVLDLSYYHVAHIFFCYFISCTFLICLAVIQS